MILGLHIFHVQLRSFERRKSVDNDPPQLPTIKQLCKMHNSLEKAAMAVLEGVLRKLKRKFPRTDAGIIAVAMRTLRHSALNRCEAC